MGAMAMPYFRLPNEPVTTDGCIEYALQDTGDGGVPLVLLQHFLGNLDNWDPALQNGSST